MSESAATLIRFADRPVTAWANGHGTTVVLWRTPDSDSDADVRLSIATVSESGPFSNLPGIDRMLMPLAAEGLTLRIDGSTQHVAQYGAVAFAGEDDVASVDVTEAGFDLNLMVRRGVGIPHLTATHVSGSARIAESGLVAVIVLAGAIGWHGRALAFGDTVLTIGGLDAIAVTGEGVAAVVSLG